MLSVTLTILPVSTLTPAPALESFAQESSLRHLHRMKITVPHRCHRCHCCPVAWMGLGLFGLVAWATKDRLAGLFVFAGLCLSLVVVWPLAVIMRWICRRFSVPRGPTGWWRRAAMMVPVVAMSYWVFSVTWHLSCHRRFPAEVLYISIAESPQQAHQVALPASSSHAHQHEGIC